LRAKQAGNGTGVLDALDESCSGAKQKMVHWAVKFTQPGQTRVGTSRSLNTLDLALDHAIVLERQNYSIEGIEGPNGETFDREAYARLKQERLAAVGRPPPSPI
jgi:hypothetical protein